MDYKEMSVRDLLCVTRNASVELRRREVIRTDNAPLGDVADYVVRDAYGGHLAANSGKSFDLVDAGGRSVQVKARTVVNQRAGATVFSPFRSFDFDVAVFLVFDRDSMDLLRAVEADADSVRKAAMYKSHTNGYVVQVRKVMSSDSGFGTDVSSAIEEAYGRI